jgi:hypothetical protein
MTLAELTRVSGKDEVLVDLRVGRIRAVVNPPRNGRVDFTVRSPVATASVRGTVFDFDTVNLNVYQGEVDFSASPGAAMPVNAAPVNATPVKAGNWSSVNEITNTVSPPATATDRALTPAPPLGTASESAAGTSISSTTSGGAGGNTGVPGETPPGETPPGETPPSGGEEGFTVDVSW